MIFSRPSRLRHLAPFPCPRQTPCSRLAVLVRRGRQESRRKSLSSFLVKTSPGESEEVLLLLVVKVLHPVQPVVPLLPQLILLRAGLLRLLLILLPLPLLAFSSLLPLHLLLDQNILLYFSI